MKRLVSILLLLTLLAACTTQEAHRVYLPDATETPAAQATPTATPEPEALTILPIEGESFSADANGVPIQNPDTHYYDYYLTLQDLRVYEHNEGTFVDATIQNAFPSTLSGGLRITFYDENGTVYGYGDFYTATGGLTLLSGDNRVYADVLTEVDVQMMTFTISVTTPIAPVD